jgi:hypothetical protein
VDPVPDPLLLRKSGSAGNRTRTSGSVAGTLTTRPQRLSTHIHIHTYIFVYIYIGIRPVIEVNSF